MDPTTIEPIFNDMLLAVIVNACLSLAAMVYGNAQSNKSLKLQKENMDLVWQTFLLKEKLDAAYKIIEEKEKN